MSRSIFLGAAMVALLAAGNLCARVINVPQDRQTISGAINAAAEGDTVLVAPGNYRCNVYINQLSITLAGRYLISGDEEDIVNTILLPADTSATIVNVSSYNDPIRLAGFTISGARMHYSITGGLQVTGNVAVEHVVVADCHSTGGAGGIMASGRATLRDCAISGNSGRRGGGMSLGDGASAIDCRIDNNSADYGGGICCALGAGGSVIGCTIQNNRAAQNGAGMYVQSSNDQAGWTVSGCEISENACNADGGAVFVVSGGKLTVSHCRISSNHSGRNGGGICSLSIQRMRIGNSRIEDNRADQIGGGVYLGQSAISMSNCIVRGNLCSTLGAGVWFQSGDYEDSFFDSTDIIGNHTSNDDGSEGGGIFCALARNLILNHCTIAGNSCKRGGALRIREDGALRVKLNSCTIAGNEADQGSALSCLDGSTNFDIRGSILWAAGESLLAGECHNVDIAYSGIEGGEAAFDAMDPLHVVWGNGNISEDPQFSAPDSGNFALGDGSPCVDAGDPDAGLDSDSSRSDIGCIPFSGEYATLRGRILDSVSDVGVPGASVTTSYGRKVITDEGGFWIMPRSRIGYQFNLVATAVGYLSATGEVADLSRGDSTECNLALPHPRPMLDPETVTVTVPPASERRESINLYNGGNATLVWRAALNVVEHTYRPLDILDEQDVSHICSDDDIHAAAFVNGVYYIAGGGDGNTRLIYVYDRDWHAIGSFAQPTAGRSGIADFAWDGSLLWGIAGDRLFGLTSDGNVEAEVTSELQLHDVLTWDSRNELLWSVSATGERLVGFTREGQRVRRVYQPLRHIYGLAFDADDPDGYCMYAAHRLDTYSGAAISRINLETGDVLQVALIDSSALLRGAFITKELVPYRLALMTILCPPSLNSQLMQVRYLADDVYFLSLSEYRGRLEHGADIDLFLNFDSHGLDLGEYRTRVLFDFPELHAREELAVVLNIAHPVAVGDGDTSLDFELAAPRPNPFNATTVFSYLLPVSSFAKLAIYDIQGREIMMLIDEEQRAGRHNVTLDATKLASGVYVARLEAAGKVAVSKVVCVK